MLVFDAAAHCPPGPASGGLIHLLPGGGKVDFRVDSLFLAREDGRGYTFGLNSGGNGFSLTHAGFWAVARR